MVEWLQWQRLVTSIKWTKDGQDFSIVFHSSGDHLGWIIVIFGGIGQDYLFPISSDKTTAELLRLGQAQ